MLSYRNISFDLSLGSHDDSFMCIIELTVLPIILVKTVMLNPWIPIG